MTTDALTVPVAAAPRVVWRALPWVGVLGLYAPLVPPMVREWIEFPNLSHGFAIPAIALYLLWSKSDRLWATAPDPSLWGFPALLAGLAGLLVGVHGSEPFLARASLPVTLLGLVLFLGGWRITRLVWMPIAYLIFMIPLPWATLKVVTYRSRLFDAAVSARLLDWLGVPILHDGVILQLPNVVLEVADECSSIPAIAALVSLGVAYAALVERPAAARAILVGATLPLAIFANIIRLVTTAGAAYYVGTWTLQTSYHMFNGTVNFAFTFLMLLGLDRVLAWWFGQRRA